MSDRKIIIEELGKPAKPQAESGGQGWDLQDGLLVSGIVSAEIAAVVIWWPAALILASVFSFVFAYLIERSKPKASKREK